MQMNWRLLTVINAAIALVTVCAVIFGVRRSHTERSHGERPYTTVHSNSASDQRAKQTEQYQVEPIDDISKARVDDLGAVPAAELTQLMSRATPEQLAAMALKFNDAPTDARTFGGMGVFFQAWTELDPKAALIGAFQLNDVTLRKLAATTVVNSVSPSAAPELIAYIKEHPDKDLSDECKNGFLSPLIGSWSLLDPAAASKFVDQLGNTNQPFDYKARQDIAHAWGTLDPEAALEWAAKQKSNESVDAASLYNEVITGWCLNNLADASAYVKTHLDNPGAGYAASSVAEAMFTRDVDGATSWINGLPEGGVARNQAEDRIATLWAEKDSPAAAHWLATLPEKDQDNLAGTIARAWVDTNWSEASRWIATLTGDVRDDALAVATHRQGATEVDSLSLALSIKSDETRKYQTETLIREWSWKDARAAEAWVKNSQLSGEEQEGLLSVIADTQKNTEEATERVIIDH
jgi:hypothetical protein